MFFFFFFFNLWELPPTLAPAAYSHGSVTNQWPRNCEAPGSKLCRCAILVPFCGALFLITVIYDLKGSGNFVLDPLEIILDLAHAAMIIINL